MPLDVRSSVIIAAAVWIWMAVGVNVAAAGPTDSRVKPVGEGAVAGGAVDRIARAALETATNRAVADVDGAERDRARLQAQKLERARRYEAELQDIDRLKQSRASWRRDRQIRTKLADSLSTARQLSALDAQVRRSDARLSRLRKDMLRAVETELRAGARPQRQEQLVTWRREAQRKLRRIKKIVLPDDSIDPLADPEELEYQASLISQSEQQLEQELASLAAQAERFRKMAALREKRARAAELGRFDDNEPRRQGPRGAAGARGEADGLGDEQPAEAPAPGAPDPSGDSPTEPPGEAPMFEGDPVLVLSEVVDAGTLEALRRADQSSDPAVKARAARRAHDKVRERLDRLRQQREQIKSRVRRLRQK